MLNSHFDMIDLLWCICYFRHSVFSWKAMWHSWRSSFLEEC